MTVSDMRLADLERSLAIQSQEDMEDRDWLRIAIADDDCDNLLRYIKR